MQEELRHVETEREVALNVARSVDLLLRSEEDAKEGSEERDEQGDPPSTAPGTQH